MCRNIKPLFNFTPPASDQKIYEASLQFVRKIAGFRKPSKKNEIAINNSVQKISADLKRLLNELQTDASPRNREAEDQKVREKNLERFNI